MTHILILRSISDREATDAMFETAVDALKSQNASYDEVVVLTPSELSLSLNLNVESKNYDGAICIGSMHKKFESPMFFELYKEVLKNLNEFSSYYAFPVAVCLLYTDDVKEGAKVARSFAHDTVSGIVNLINSIRQLNSLDSEPYVGSKKHN